MKCWYKLKTIRHHSRTSKVVYVQVKLLQQVLEITLLTKKTQTDEKNMIHVLADIRYL